MTRQDGISERDAIPIMPGEKETRRLRFDGSHLVLEPAKTDFVLRDGAAEQHVMLPGRPPVHSQEPAEVPANQFHQRLRLEQGELGVPGPTDVGGERHVTGRSPVWKERGGEERAQDLEPFDLWDHDPKSDERMTHAFAAES